MKVLIVEKVLRIIKNRKKLEEKLRVKITNRGKEVSVSGRAEDEYTAEQVILALDFGFPFSTAIGIKENDFVFEIINIKDHTNRHDLERIRGRIIGKKGKALSTLSQLTGCNFEIKDNKIGIVGAPEKIENAQEAVISLIKGSKHSNIYSHLEKHQVKPVGDLGLKE